MDLDLNVLCVQVLPVHLDPRGTMEKVGRMIAKYSEADVVVLPEMAFSGYTFNDFEEIDRSFPICKINYSSANIF